MKKYLRKNVPFDPENKEEMTLYEWLQSLPHGKFSEGTKNYWMKKMRKEQSNGESISDFGTTD